MKPFAESFYKSQAWERTRTAYAKSVGGLCEPCYQKGIIRAGEIVHHKIQLSPDNIRDSSITLNWDNLMLVCRDCHAQIHNRIERRYEVDENGKVTVKEEAK